MSPEDDSGKLFSIAKVKPATHTLTNDLYTELKIVCAATGFIQPPSVCIYNWTQSSKWQLEFTGLETWDGGQGLNPSQYICVI